MNNKLEIVQHVLDEFPSTFQSLIIGTTTEYQQPFTSYAPFVKVDNDYYFIISKVAKHYLNLKLNPIASILLIEDESSAKNIFFRKRLSYLVNTELDVVTSDIQQAFIDKFGEFASMLFTMDFIVVKCEILEGHIIVGAGQAYQINHLQKITTQMKGNSGNGHQSE